MLSGPVMNPTTSKANELEKRLISFAAAILALSSKLPRTPQGRHVCGQMLRSGTAAAANYGEARGAESSMSRQRGLAPSSRKIANFGIIAASIRTARVSAE
jgi:hypothetical protein